MINSQNQLSVIQDRQKGALQVAMTANSIMQKILDASSNPDFDVSKMQALREIHKDILCEQYTQEANQAFARVVRNMPRIKRNGMIDFGKGGKPIPYARWEDVQDVIRPIYENEGFTLSFDAQFKDGGGCVYTAILTHQNGNTRNSSIPLPLDTSGGKQNIQGMGSTASYGQRYTTKQLFNLVFENEDDDGKMGSMVTIDDEKLGIINALIKETKTDERRFCETLGFHSVSGIQVKDFPRAMNALSQKKKKIQAEAAK
jgi:ERF superfamily